MEDLPLPLPKQDSEVSGLDENIGEMSTGPLKCGVKKSFPSDMPQEGSDSVNFKSVSET